MLPRRSGGLQRRGGRILRRLGLIDKGLVPNNMNPFDYWYETKPELRAFLSSYFDETRPLLQAYPELDAAADTLFRSSRTMDKLLAVNLLAAMKHYFPKS
ncbi:MAG: hypothetical protein MJ118_08955 [Clostridia bacterium]|nr:hypothetical protein [Clostridia bacterium]